MSEFSPKTIDSHFSNVERVVDAFGRMGFIENEDAVLYSVNDKYGNTAGEISYMGENEWRIYVDNFPSPKRYFNTNLPIKTLKQFESDIARTGLKLVRKG